MIISAKWLIAYIQKIMMQFRSVQEYSILTISNNVDTKIGVHSSRVVCVQNQFTPKLQPWVDTIPFLLEMLPYDSYSIFMCHLWCG